ncbi:tRNA (guanine-N(7)-)-methyltransferase [Striga asiatica]|uniref:tRNA (Guanine-N(7)-)-methyltransferase n=1 Tax=Striga asiatica TaxID=4170 RepID=A0A5A7RB13_STRAF|nr:tRNA (guanine-N(7)-)-methyltransferase [Striga asiatica]
MDSGFRKPKVRSASDFVYHYSMSSTCRWIQDQKHANPEVQNCRWRLVSNTVNHQHIQTNHHNHRSAAKSIFESKTTSRSTSRIHNNAAVIKSSKHQKKRLAIERAKTADIKIP